MQYLSFEYLFHYKKEIIIFISKEDYPFLQKIDKNFNNGNLNKKSLYVFCQYIYTTRVNIMVNILERLEILRLKSFIFFLYNYSYTQFRLRPVDTKTYS